MTREVKENAIESSCENVGKSMCEKKRKALSGKRKWAVPLLTALLTATLLAGCVNDEGAAANESGKRAITLIAREDGSGTRAAFNELMGISADGVDHTSLAAEVSQSTAVVMASVAGNKNAIAYASLGSMNESVKAVSIDGTETTAASIKNGSYAAARAFLLLTGKNASPQAEDFLSFVLSKEGQEIVAEEAYISVDEKAASYETGKKISGRILITGSTSLAPVVQRLADAYKELHDGVTIEIQQTGSGAGITSIIEGACDLAMSSRELKPEESAEGISANEIALDGIVVIVNKENAIDELTREQIRRIFTGELTDWSEVK